MRIIPSKVKSNPGQGDAKKGIMDLLKNARTHRYAKTKKQPRIKPHYGIFGTSVWARVKRDSQPPPPNDVAQSQPKPIKERVKARIDDNLDFLLENQSDRNIDIKRFRKAESYINLAATKRKAQTQNEEQPIEVESIKKVFASTQADDRQNLSNEVGDRADGTQNSLFGGRAFPKSPTVIDMTTPVSMPAPFSEFNGTINSMDFKVANAFDREPPTPFITPSEAIAFGSSFNGTAEFTGRSYEIDRTGLSGPGHTIGIDRTGPGGFAFDVNGSELTDHEFDRYRTGPKGTSFDTNRTEPTGFGIDRNIPSGQPFHVERDDASEQTFDINRVDTFNINRVDTGHTFNDYNGIEFVENSPMANMNMNVSGWSADQLTFHGYLSDSDDSVKTHCSPSNRYRDMVMWTPSVANHVMLPQPQPLSEQLIARIESKTSEKMLQVIRHLSKCTFPPVCDDSYVVPCVEYGTEWQPDDRQTVAGNWPATSLQTEQRTIINPYGDDRSNVAAFQQVFQNAFYRDDNVTILRTVKTSRIIRTNTYSEEEYDFQNFDDADFAF